MLIHGGLHRITCIDETGMKTLKSHKHSSLLRIESKLHFKYFYNIGQMWRKGRSKVKLGPVV